MGMGRKRWRQESSWVAIRELPRTKGHVFYDWVNRILEEHGFDKFAESVCEKFYATRGRPSVAPGVYPSGERESFALTRQCRCIPIVATHPISRPVPKLGPFEIDHKSAA